MINKIISGGQKGADIAGIDASIELGIPYGGYLTKGRRQENDDMVPLSYDKFIELDTWDYPTRTEKNVVESDGTIIITINGLTGGSRLTRDLLLKHKKPFIWVDMDKMGAYVASDKIVEFLRARPEIQILNVAGSRGSKAEGFQELAHKVLKLALSQILRKDDKATGVS